MAEPPVIDVDALVEDLRGRVARAREQGLYADDLSGQTVGIPGNFGESLYGLLALRYANNLDETAFTVQEIGWPTPRYIAIRFLFWNGSLVFAR